MIPCFPSPESISLSIHLLIYETRTSRHTLYMYIKSRIRNEGERIQTDECSPLRRKDKNRAEGV